MTWFKRLVHVISKEITDNDPKVSSFISRNRLLLSYLFYMADVLEFVVSIVGRDESRIKGWKTFGTVIVSKLSSGKAQNIEKEVKFNEIERNCYNIMSTNVRGFGGLIKLQQYDKKLFMIWSFFRYLDWKESI